MSLPSRVDGYGYPQFSVVTETTPSRRLENVSPNAPEQPEVSDVLQGVSADIRALYGGLAQAGRPLPVNNLSTVQMSAEGVGRLSGLGALMDETTKVQDFTLPTTRFRGSRRSY